MSMVLAANPVDHRFRKVALAILLTAFAYKSGELLVHMARTQPLGSDFSCFWAGARVALTAPRRIYDFAYVSQYQGWPMGPELRPFVYPPSALLLFMPLAALPMTVAYVIAMTATASLFLWACVRAGAPWWTALFPVFWLIVGCGQITFAVGGIVLVALTLPRRPMLAGVLFGIAAALKPQVLILLPVGLLADRSWRALVGATATGLILLAVSVLAWGPHLWLDWLAALPRFQREVIPSIPGLRGDEITPYAALELAGLHGALAFVLAPLAIWLTWRTYRDSHDPLLRAAAALGGALLVSPYAMNYEAGLLAPSVAALAARRQDRLWPLYATLAAGFVITTMRGPGSLLAGLAAPTIAQLSPQLRRVRQVLSV